MSRVTQFTVKDFMRVEAVDITPDGDTVTVSGANGSGKTSTMRALAATLGGDKLCPREPVRNGADKAVVRVKLSDGIIATRTFTPDGKTKLELTSEDGARYPKPQTVLSGMIGELAWDPLAFDRMKPEEQVALLRKIAGVDTSKLEAERQCVYDDRTEVGREAKRLSGALEKMPPTPKDVPAEEVSIDDLAAELERRRAVNAEHRDSAQKLDGMRLRAVALKQEIAKLQTQLEQVTADGKAQAEKVAGLSTADEGEVLEQLKTVQSTNAAVRAAAERRKLADELEAAIAKSEALTKRIGEIDVEKEKLLAAANLPVKGLTFDDSGVRLDGVPYAQGSGRDRLVTSAGIGSALNQKLRIMSIDEADKLDKPSKAALCEFAKERDLQIWFFQVGTDGATVVLEDGHVAGAEPEKAAESKDEKPRGDGKTKAQRGAEFIAKNKAAREPGAEG